MVVMHRARVFVYLALMMFIIITVASCGGGGSKTVLPPANNNNNNNQTDELPIIDLTPPVVAENPGDVGGIVKDAMGVAVGDVEIAVDDADISAMTADDGTFLISEVAAGSHTLTFSKEGHILFTKPIDVDGNTPANITFTSSDTRSTSQLDNPAEMHGLVYEDSTEVPVPGAWVIVFDYEGFFRVTRSNDSGNYSFEMLPAGDHQVLAFKRGFKVYFGGVTLIGGHDTVKNIPLVRINSGNVKGHVTNLEGQGIIGASVFLLCYEGEGYGGKFHTFTDANGFYEFENVPAGEADMLAVHRYYKPASATVTVIAGQTIEQNFQLEPKEESEIVVLEGLIRNPEEQPIAGALIKLFGDGEHQWQTKSKENGGYRLELPHAGVYTIQVTKQGFNTYEGTIELVAGVNHKNITLIPVGGETHFGAIEGKVYRTGDKCEEFGPVVPGALVELVRPGTDFYRSTQTNDEGYFHFGEVPVIDGYYVIEASHPDHGSGRVDEIVVDPGQTTWVDVVLNGEIPEGCGTIWVVVRDQYEEPVEGAVVKVWHNNLEGDLFGEKLTDANGVAKFVEVPAPGTYAVKAFKWDRCSGVVSVSIEPGAQAEVHLTIECPQGGETGTLFGHVQDAYLDFGWLEGVLVKVYQNEVVIADAITNAEGYYAIDGIPAGTYNVRFSKEGYETRWYEHIVIVGGHETELNAELYPLGNETGVLFGHVRDIETEEAIPEALVKIFSGEQVIAHAYTNVYGYYIIDGIPAGTYNVRFTHPDYNTYWSESVVITDGGETELNAYLTPLGGGDENGVLFGHVKNGHDQTVIPGAGVAVWQNEVVVAEATTNGEGYYVIDGLPAGTYAVKFYKEGFTHKWYEGVVIIGGQHTELNAVLYPSEPPANGVLLGHVRNSVNEALLPEVQVTVFQGEVQKRQVYTNVDGYYATDGLPAGYYSVRFTKTGFETYWAYEVHIIAGNQTELNAYLDPIEEPQTARMYGHVRNMEEQPLPGAVVLLGHFENEEYVTDYSATAGEVGYYVIEGIEPGAYVIRVHKEGYQLKQDDISFEAGDNRLVNISLQMQG